MSSYVIQRQLVMDLHPEQNSENFMYFEAISEAGERTDGYYMTIAQYERFEQPTSITILVHRAVIEPDPPPEEPL